jgi:protein-serine/threonine kinase
VKDTNTTMEEASYLPSPPQSPSKSAAMESSPKPKSGFSHRLHKMNTLFRKGGKGKAKDVLRSLQSVDMTEATQVVNDEVEPDESSPATNTDSSVKSSSNNSNSHSGISPNSTGKTSLDSKSNPSSSGKEKDANDAAEKKQQHDAGTVVNRRNPPRTYSSLETSLAPIQETALDGTTTTILTVERAAAAKIYLETYFNTLLSSTPSPRSVRRDKLEADIKRRLDDDENFTPEEQENMRKDFYSRETQHLRESRTLKTRSILSRAAEKGNLAAKTVEDDYEVLKILGKGSFGVVRLVKEKGRLDQHISDGSSGRDRKQVYAMKVIRKSDMLRTSQEGHLRAERDFLVASEGSEW